MTLKYLTLERAGESKDYENIISTLNAIEIQLKETNVQLLRMADAIEEIAYKDQPSGLENEE